MSETQPQPASAKRKGFSLPFFRRNRDKPLSGEKAEIAARKAIVEAGHRYLSEATELVLENRDHPHIRSNGHLDMFEERWSELYGSAPSGKKFTKGRMTPEEFRDYARELLDDAQIVLATGKFGGRSASSSQAHHNEPPQEIQHEIRHETPPPMERSKSNAKHSSNHTKVSLRDEGFVRSIEHERSADPNVSRKTSNRHRRRETEDDLPKSPTIPEEDHYDSRKPRHHRQPTLDKKRSDSSIKRSQRKGKESKHSVSDEDEEERRRRRRERRREELPREERYPDERYKDDRYKDDRDRYRDERYKDGKYKDDRYKDDRYKDGRYKDDRYKDDRYGDDRYKEDRRRDDRYYRDDRYNDRYRDDRYKDDRYRDDRRRKDKDGDKHRHRDDRYGDEVGRRLDDDRYYDKSRGSTRHRGDHDYDDKGREYRRRDKDKDKRARDEYRDEPPPEEHRRHDRPREVEQEPDHSHTREDNHAPVLPTPVPTSPTYIPYPAEPPHPERPRHGSRRDDRRHYKEDKRDRRRERSLHRDFSPPRVGDDSGQPGSDQMAPLMIPPPRAPPYEPRSRFREEFSVHG